MARFKTVRIVKGTAPNTAWAKMRNELVTAFTVEVVVNEQNGGFDLHVWFDERADGSNGPDADPGTEY